MSNTSERRVIETLRDVAERVYDKAHVVDPAQFAGVVLRQIDRQGTVDREDLLRVALQAWVIAFFADKRHMRDPEMASVLGDGRRAA